MSLKITPLGGLGEIGMNCMVLEGQQSAFVLDCGLMFSELDHFGVEFVIPNFKHLIEKKDKIKGIVCTHGHEDHIGAVPLLLKAGIQVPIYASAFTALMIRERLKEVGLDRAAKIIEMPAQEKFKIGEFEITPVNVNHSIIDAVALFIDTPVGRVIHTGDFKIDASAYFGDVLNPNEFKKWGDEGVLLLMSDSTNIEVEHKSTGEGRVAQNLEALIAQATGRVMVTLFSSNIGRIANLFKIAKKLNKKIVLTGRSMEQNIRLALERGGLNFDLNQMVAMEDLHRFEKNKILILSTGCQGEPRSALNRIAHEEHSDLQIDEGDTVIFSSSQIPGNEKPISRLINDLYRLGAEVIHDALDEVHSSGHATRSELEKMLNWVKPKYFMPVHGEYRHLVKHAELAEDCGIQFENIRVAQNGDVMELSSSHFEKTEQLEDLKVFVADREGEELPKSLIRDRRKIAETGVVFILLSRDKHSGKILHSPEVLLKGVVAEPFEAFMIEEAKKILQTEIGHYKKELKHDFIDPDFPEKIRLAIRRFFERNTGKKPVVIPFILE